MKRFIIKWTMAILCICLLGTVAEAKSRKISGRVFDADGEPLPGAVVAIGDGSSGVGVTTDENGKYTIDVPSREKTLEFSFLGLKTTSVFINNRLVIDVILESDASTELDDAVVVGYGKTKVRDLTGSISSVSSEQLNSGTPMTIDQALKGKVAGLQIMQSDGTPGGRVSIKIRGTNSITAGSSPLYVIDGFPMPYSEDPSVNPLTNIPPSSIESITILKDASSTAIYGSQGANGVILITTKTAKAGMNDLSVNVNYGVGHPARRMEMLGPEAYMMNLMRSNYTNPNADLYDKLQSRAWEDPSQITDWFEECTRPSLTKSVDVSYLGSIANRIRNSTNVSYNDDEGTIINTGYRRFYILQQNDIIVNKRFNVNTMISYENGKRYGANWIDGGIFNDILTYCPFIPKEWGWKDTEAYLKYNKIGDNPYMRLTQKEYNADNRNLYASINAKFYILDNLSVSAGYNMGHRFTEARSHIPTTIKSSYESKGYATISNQKSQISRFNAQVDYNLNRNGHYFTATGVFETYSQTDEGFGAEYTNFSTDLGWHGISGALPGDHVEAPSVAYTQKTMVSILGRLTYNYENKYYATINMREDASSRFSRNNRWGFFPSAAISWRVANENFWKNSTVLKNVINDLKIRASWGQVGNDQIADYQYFQFLKRFDQTATFTSPDGKPVTADPYQLALMSSDVKWETSSEWNIGLDINMFNNRLIANIDAYHKVTRDMLLNERIALTSGFETMTRNIGSVRNRGIEISLSGSIVQTKDWNYDVNVVYSANRSKVLSLGTREQTLEGRYIGNSSSENIMIKEGYPLGMYFGNIVNGIANNEITNANAWPSSYGAVNPSSSYDKTKDLFRKYIVQGKFMFDDLDGDGITDGTDRLPLACTEPAFIGGMSHSLRYKWFTLQANFSWSYGNDIINGNIYNLINAGFGINNKLASVADNTWHENNPGGTYAKDGSYRSISNSELVEDGSFFRMNNLSITAQMPEQWLKKMRAKNISLTYSLRNAFCITRYSGYDPEVNSGTSRDTQILGGVDYASYPTVRSHVFSLNIKF